MAKENSTVGVWNRIAGHITNYVMVIQIAIMDMMRSTVLMVSYKI